jgi:hypothetical protein
VWKSWFSERVIGYEYHNLVFWAIKIVKLVRNSACFPLLPFIESMALIFCFFQRTGVGKNPSSINYANEVRIIFTKKTIEFEWLEELAKPFGLTPSGSEDIGEKPVWGHF